MSLLPTTTTTNTALLAPCSPHKVFRRSDNNSSPPRPLQERQRYDILEVQVERSTEWSTRSVTRAMPEHRIESFALSTDCVFYYRCVRSKATSCDMILLNRKSVDPVDNNHQRALLGNEIRVLVSSCHHRLCTYIHDGIIKIVYTTVIVYGRMILLIEYFRMRKWGCQHLTAIFELRRSRGDRLQRWLLKSLPTETKRIYQYHT